MIAVTSISPTHANNNIQKQCVDSWLSLGFKVISFNCEAESSILKDKYLGVEFIATERTMEGTYQRPLINLSAIFDWCKKEDNDNFVIINSDIELVSDKETIERIEVEMQSGLVLANRINYDNEKKGAHYLAGIDVFFIHKKYLSIFPQTMNCLGMTFYDYFIPYVALKNGVNCTFLKQDFAYHKNHSTQYSNDNWLKSGRYFLWEQGLYQFDDIKGIGQMSNYVYNFIYNASTKKQI